MTQVVVPRGVASLAGDFSDAAPGHRFNLYFPFWDHEWSPENQHKKDAIGRCTKVPTRVVELLDGLRDRQRALFEGHPEGLRIAAVSTAPFATGLGNEHPVENGFAFLTPYGLPYLAGSGVKGILRRAAEELALFPDEYAKQEAAGLTLLDIWWLFGFEGAAGGWWALSRKEEESLSEQAKVGRAILRERYRAHLETLAEHPDLPAFIGRVVASGNEQARYLNSPRDFLDEIDDRRREIHNRGALSFWDVFPQPPKRGEHKDRLAVEIMTPHFSDYYQHGGTPNDAGQPTPIPFLAVPSGSSFDFHVVCAEHGLPESLRPNWKALVQSLFAHAFDWLGFGARTAVGYGVMQRDAEREVQEAFEREERSRKAREDEEARRAAQEREEALAQLSPVERSIHEFLDSRPNKNQPEISDVIAAAKQGLWPAQDLPAVARWLERRMKATTGQWKETSNARRPERDREHQRTLLVLKWLDP